MNDSNEGRPHSTFAILGAGGGVGSSLARILGQTRARLFLGGRDIQALQRLAEEVGGTPFEVDGRDFEQTAKFLEAAAAEGSLAGVANCAGSLLLKPAHLTSRSEFDETVGANLTTAFSLVRAAARSLGEGGSIVLVSSGAASIGMPNHEAIAAAKAGVEGLVRAAAASYARRRIRVNAVAPGLVETPLTERITSNEKALEASLRLHPLGRVGRPEEIASAMAWLLNDASGWVTGQIFHVDGGLAALKGVAA